MSNEALIAAFLAKGGRISKVEQGVQSLNLTPRQWREQTQMTKAERLGMSISDDELPSERRLELARDFARVGDHEAAYAAAAGEFE